MIRVEVMSTMKLTGYGPVLNGFYAVAGTMAGFFYAFFGDVVRPLRLQ